MRVAGSGSGTTDRSGPFIERIEVLQLETRVGGVERD